MAPGFLRPMRTGPRLATVVLLLAVPAVLACYSGLRRGQAAVPALTGAGLVVAAGYAAATTRRMRGDTARAVAAIRALAEDGGPDLPVPQGPGELGDIGRALAGTRTLLRARAERQREIRTGREEQFQIGFQHQKQAERRLRERAQEIIDESTSVIAEELRLVTEQVGAVRRAADTIDGGIAATDAATSAVVDHARRAEEVIAELERSLRGVADTAQLVRGIAGQTRLLALNATIEAARAGELGLGFTVVADEVKQLATSTADSTEQITGTIAELERDTARMAGAIAAMVAGIGSVGEAATSLRAVASDQGTVVGRLTERMGRTIGRVEDMSGLAAQLERRQSRRVDASGTVRLHRRGSEPVDAALIDVSTGGLRVRPAAADLAAGDMVEVEGLGVPGEPIEVLARIESLGIGAAGDEAGLQLMITDGATAERLERYLDHLNHTG
ncbi:methyl-accepting chemotaxis protein [Pseudosporangium ferrugineum]|uniref:Methyl-accepting chemotaxis protein n=2 Tax=Pseudosporangium ferrugineum TaxID=439699 RepID=A0A2T0R923_9ACTN|nr:methyl-accepting chemotaxis protein [Pseudosporangium ferrugineum]